ncbi:hypothetical protein Cde04nite_31490 [Cellulomonas denverensis]|nr:hypothetical protein Cde04nite_31490 [Cellulomonas denverensis]
MFLHRSIGGYITMFSEMTASMRQQIGAYLAPVDVEFPISDRLLDVLFASMTAKPIVDAFFSLSTEVGKLDADEAAIRNQLRRRVNEHLAFRNDLAHAEWSIGWQDADTGERLPPAALRIKSSEGVPRLQDVGISSQVIGSHIDEVNQLRRLVMVFGRCCRARQRGHDVRLFDLLAVGPEGMPVEGSAEPGDSTS